jgi:hypothetical protein
MIYTPDYEASMKKENKIKSDVLFLYVLTAQINVYECYQH